MKAVIEGIGRALVSCGPCASTTDPVAAGIPARGAGTSLVGSADNVAALMREYAAVGIETFILSGYPHLEEAYRCAELLFPRLPLDHGGDSAAGLRPTQAGEVVANEHNPQPATANGASHAHAH